MKQKQSSGWESLMQPMIDIAEINRKTIQQFAKLQGDYMSWALEANLKQFKALAETEDMKSAVEKQLKFMKELDSRWCDTAEQEIATARDAQHSINNMLEESYLRSSDFFEQFSPSPDKTSH